ncbi:hypothetical protein D9M72_371030 [compost metagenome]
MVEVDAVDIGFDHVVAHGLAKTEQAILLAQGEEMLQQARAMVGRQLAHQYGGAVGGLCGFGCLAQIFVGQCADGLAQFERVHDYFLPSAVTDKNRHCVGVPPGTFPWFGARLGGNTILMRRQKYCSGIVSSA